MVSRLTRLFVFGLGVILVLAVQAFSADATGTWSGEVTLPTGLALPFVAHLVQEDAVITGTLAGIGGAPDVDIMDGKIDGATITFSGVRQIQDADVKFNYIGTLAGDTIDFTILREDGQQAPLRTLTKRTD